MKYERQVSILAWPDKSQRDLRNRAGGNVEETLHLLNSSTKKVRVAPLTFSIGLSRIMKSGHAYLSDLIGRIEIELS